MKKNIIYILVAFILIAIVVVGVITSRPKPNPVIIKNEIVLQNEKDDYMQVRHIVVKGSNEGIGRALGEIARRKYKAKLIKYAEPIYAKARLQYMKTNYPILLERMKGVASAYGLSFDNTDYDTSNLYYCAPAPKCSAIFFPAKVSADGHTFYSCNRDYYLASMSEIMGEKRKKGELDFLSRVIVIEMYPDNGYSSIGIYALGLLNMQFDIINSKGLSVAILEDDTYGMEHIFKDLTRQSGLQTYQAVHLIADTCATVEEAKEALLNNKISMSLLPAHFMVMDSSGRSFIYERSSEDFGDRFIDGAGQVQIITNHSVYEYPTVKKFPKPSENDYDTFTRYRRLDKYVEDHKGKFSKEDGEEALSLAYGRVEEAGEGGHHELPLRTLYTAIMDLDERTMQVRFYLRDKKPDRRDGLANPLFSEPFEFKLKTE